MLRMTFVDVRLRARLEKDPAMPSTTSTTIWLREKDRGTKIAVLRVYVKGTWQPRRSKITFIAWSPDDAGIQASWSLSSLWFAHYSHFLSPRWCTPLPRMPWSGRSTELLPSSKQMTKMISNTNPSLPKLARVPHKQQELMITINQTRRGRRIHVSLVLHFGLLWYSGMGVSLLSANGTVNFGAHQTYQDIKSDLAGGIS